MTDYLLDTQAVVWLALRTRTAPARVMDAVEDEAVGLAVSAVSAMEVATKTRIGKLGAAPLVEGWAGVVGEFRAAHLDLTTEHAILAGSLDWEHRDPFDRLLAAQALHEGLTLLTADRVFATMPDLDVFWW